MSRERELAKGDPTPLKRFAVTVIAIAAVLAAVIIAAKLFGEFIWHIPR